MLSLDVPYEEKDQAKALGAWWDTSCKKWTVSNPRDYYKFKKWIKGNVILSDCFYLVESKTNCWRCHKETKVLAIGVESIMEICGEPTEFENDGIHIASGFESLPEYVLNYIKKHYPIKNRFSKTINKSYLSNGCEHCDALQGDWFLFNEPDSPFMIDSDETAKNLTLYKVNLTFDLPMYLSVGYSSEDSLIKQFAKIIDFPIPPIKY